MPIRSRLVALAASITLLSGIAVVGFGEVGLPSSGASALTGAAMPLQEFVNDGAWGRLWNNYNQTANSQGPAVTGRPSAITYGNSVHVYARANGGDLMEFDNDGVGNRLWNAYDLTQSAAGATIGADPAAVLIGGTAIHVFAESANGDLVEFNNDGSGAHPWSAHDVTQLAGGLPIGGDPSPVLNGTALDVFARDTNGNLEEFVDNSPASQSWSALNVSSVAVGPQIGGDPGAVVSGGALHVYAASITGDLLEFTSAGGGTWAFSDLTQTTGAPTVTGRPSPVVVGSTIHVYARTVTGDLGEFAYSGSWGYSDLSSGAGGPAIGGDPGAVLYGVSVIHVYTEATTGHLTEFVNDGQRGRTWNAYDLTQGAGGTTVGGDPSPMVYGATVHVYVGGPPPATPPAGVGLYGLDQGAQTAQAIEDNWPVIGDTGALGTQTVPYTGLNEGADLATGQSIAASGRRITWLSFWTVSGPVASGAAGAPCYTSDCYYADAFSAGQWVAHTIDGYPAAGLHLKPDWVIIDPEGYPDNHSGLDSGPGAVSANWFSFLQGWNNGLTSIDPSLRAGFYADQSEVNNFDLSSVQLPEFVAIAFPGPQNILSNTNNVAGYIAFGATCPAAGEEQTLVGPAWNGAYNTLQFAGGAYCAP